MITSNQNQTFKYLLKLKKAKYRKQYQEAIIFGQDVIDAAIEAGVVVSFITTVEKEEAICLEPSLFDSLADYEMQQKVGAVVKIERKNHASNRILVLENIQDPRNVGALFRSALAFGFKKVFLSKDCADPYHELALRSAKGTTFGLDIEEGYLLPYIKTLKEKEYHIIGTSPKKGEKLKLYPNKLALILGNEGQGLTHEIITQCDHFMHIETESVESLNVSVAGAICMYEIRSHS